MFVAKSQFVRGFSASAILISIVLAGGCASATPAAEQPVTGKKLSFWPPAPDEPHIQFLTTFNTSADVGASQGSKFEQMLYGSGADQVKAIDKPYGVRMWNGRIYICDERGHSVVVLDLKKKQTRLMGISGSALLQRPIDLTITPDGVKYVIDQAQSSIFVYDADEKFYTTFPVQDAQLNGIAVFENVLYVTDFKHKHVKVLDRANGHVLRTFGEPGGEDGQFVGPVGVTTDKAGNVYVTDAMKARVQKFSPAGKFLMAFGRIGDRPGDFIRPKQLAVGSDGFVHVVDAGFYNVQVFDPRGQVVGYYGSPGAHPGAMDLPAGMEICENDLELFEKYAHPAFEMERVILVTNQFGNHKVSAYAMGHLRAGKTVADVAPRRADVAMGLTTQPVVDPLATPRPARAAQSAAAAPAAASTPKR